MGLCLDVLRLVGFLIYSYIDAFISLFVSKKRKDVTDQVVLITGAGHGIGREIALEFGRLGARTVLWDLNKDCNDATAAEIKQNGGSAISYLCDVGNIDDIKRVSVRVSKDVGEVDILVNNAGILYGGELLKMEEKHIRRTFDVNTMAHFWTVREFLPAMMRKNKGHIVTISSMSAKSGTAFLVDYSASKCAVSGFTEALAEELEVLGHDGIKTTIVCPLFVQTGLSKNKFRFGKMLTTEETAMATVDGTLKEEPLVLIPGHLWVQYRISDMFFPVKFHKRLKKFFQFGIEPQYETKQD